MNEYNLSPEERATLIKLLRRVDPKKPFGTELFDAIAAVSVNVAFEALALRQSNKGLEVFLTRRLETDKAYPGMWHSPGTVLRPGEEIADAFIRLEEREFKSKLESREFIGIHNHLNEARGHFFAHLYLCKLNSPSDNWFSVDNLPQPMVEHHEIILIPSAVKAFKERQAK